MNVAAAKGPLPAKMPQAAKPARMSAVVAVSRGPHRRAAHSQRQDGEEGERAPRDALLDQRTEGDAAHDARHDEHAPPEAPILRRLKGRKSPSAQSTMTGATTSTPAASRSHHVLHVAMTSADSRYPPKTKPATPAVALIIVAPRHDEGEFRDARRRVESLAAVRPDIDQIPADDRRQRIPAATAKDIMIESAAVAPTRSVGTPAA